MRKKTLSLSLLSATILLSGCSLISGTEAEKNTYNGKKSDIVLEDEFVDKRNLSTEDDILSSSDKQIYTLKQEYSMENILVNDEYSGVPRSLINKKIDSISFNRKKLGSAIELLLDGVDKVSLMIGPNVDLNTNVNIKIHNKNLYETLQRIAFSVGYHLYYDQVEKSIIVSPYQKRTYRIPSGILLSKTAENQLQGGSTITLKPEDPYMLLEKGLKEAVGSQNKGVYIDKDSGLIVVKDHPAYIPEIDEYVLSFVQDRSRQFMIEAAIVEITHTDTNALGFDINNLQTSVGDLPVFVSSITGGSGFTGARISSNFANESVSLDSILTAIRGNSVTNVVDRPRVIIFNHSVGFVNRGSEKSYISGTEKIVSELGNTTGVAQKVETYQDGLKLAMRVDAIPKKDLITLSLAPSIKTGRLEPVPGDESGAGVEKLLLETRELMTNANLKDGDIIVLGGIKSYAEQKTNEQTPFFYSIPFIGDIFQNNKNDLTKIETLFLVKVTEIKTPNQTMQDAKLESLDLLKKAE